MTGMQEVKRMAGGVAEFKQDRMVAIFPQGELLFRSADKPDNLRSKTAYGIVLDEAPLTDGYAWSEVLRPMLLDTNGWAWLTGTPNGRNWYWQLWQSMQSHVDWAFFNAPTLGCEITADGLKRKPHPLENPFVKFDEIENIYRTVSQRTFRQEILAEFVEDGGGVFRDVINATRATPQAQAQPGHAYVIGADWGRTNDATVFVVVDITTREACYIDRMEGTPYAMQLTRLRALWERFGQPPIIAELNSMGGPQVESAQQNGLPVQGLTTTNATKAQWIDALALAFEQGTISIIPDQTLVTELQAFESTRLPSGMVRYAAPDGLHDDTVIALALAWQGVGNSAPLFYE